MSLEQVEALVATLDPSDQVRLLERLAERLHGSIPAEQPQNIDAAAAWQAFREVGKRLAEGCNEKSITQEIFDMRR